ncbi:hypothetical protein BT69DRAFT_1349368 [Atractiella rhizophila]|nr:hypothetical protein BT69DRAFT_1349368 [Atractiella rhizophila]
MSASADNLELECWLYGQDPSHTFLVTISKKERLAGLKRLIHSQKPQIFHDVEAGMLDLYRVSCSDEEELSESVLNNVPKLTGPLKLLAKLFSDYDPEKELVVVRSPNISLNYWIRGTDIGTVLTIDISGKQNVGQLKKAIKSHTPHYFPGIHAELLALYQVDLLNDESLKEKLKGASYDKPLRFSTDLLSEIFVQALNPHHVHVVVDAPASAPLRSQPPSIPHSAEQHRIRALRHRFLEDNERIAPSTGAEPNVFAKRQSAIKHQIFCNRPRSATTTNPTTLLHPVFGRFLDDCENYEITAADNAFVMELSSTMSDFYPSEVTRAAAVRELFAEWGVKMVVSHTPGEFVTDGDKLVRKHRCAIMEFKNEISSKGAEPYAQAGLNYFDSTGDHATVFERSPLPCILILVFGPYIAFAGAAWDLRPQMETLSVCLPLHYHLTDEDTRRKVARHVGALKKAVTSLEEYYQNLKPEPESQQEGLVSITRRQSQIFPYPRSFTSLKDGTLQTFEYERQPFGEKLLFFCEQQENGVRLCVKFVRRYSKQAHEICAEKGFAPALHGFEKIAGGWFMVVMDLLSDEDYHRFDIKTASPTDLDGINGMLDELHQRGLVHGDVRDVNLLVSQSDPVRVMLVDFDWAGKMGEVKYPMNVNRKDMWRPEGAVDGALIKAEHDMSMLDQISQKVTAYQGHTQ